MKGASLPGLAVLNPNGRDPDLPYQQGTGLPDPSVHAPVNYHAYAACTGGGFYRTPKLAARHRNVLLLLRGDLTEARKAFDLLKSQGCFVAIAFKEAGTHQVAAQLQRHRALVRFQTLAAEAELCLSSTPELVTLYQSVSSRVAEIPTPYPVDVPGWDFARPPHQRAGVFIGTREFDVPTRNHLVVLSAARGLATRLTVVAGAKDVPILAALQLGPERIHAVRPLPYPAYLRLMATHRLVLQFDQSCVPGQVAGDALLCGLPAVGGHGAVERLILPELNGYGRDFRTLLEFVHRLLGDDKFYHGQVQTMKALAGERLSFQAIRRQLETCFPGLGG
ncbi:MAG: glycosyltransferase [Verrucomicrobia bacterium]|nr:glycosyltransferase [Verrucomicrobiota bacterium]